MPTLSEKWFDQDGQYNRQNDCVYAESREAANEDFGTRPVHKFPFKVMVWAGITFNGVTGIVIRRGLLHRKRSTNSEKRRKQIDWAPFHFSTRRR